MKPIKNLTELVSRIGRNTSYRHGTNPSVDAAVSQLRDIGFVKLDHLVGSPVFDDMKASLNQRIEKDFEFNLPCLAQTKIDNDRDQDLIAKNFLTSNDQLVERNLTFCRDDVSSYDQMLADFQPSSLTLPILSDPMYYNLWLDPMVMEIVSSYIGFVPHMTEAYTRRNFPSSYKIMNHNWHRDTNHDKYLVKAFIFFTDCDIDTGAHHYIAGSIHDSRFRDKVYFTDQEIHSAWPYGSDDHIISTVPAGTIIIEDTRGLHKAGIPNRDYRDLGFAIFMPPNIFRPSRPLYYIKQSSHYELSAMQKAFIPNKNIIPG
tara:strand:- start:116 stop:1063 length:948 start_codon:yes stop_codon:yes gene_type:complete